MQIVKELFSALRFLPLPIMFFALIVGVNTASAHCGGKHGPGHPHCGGTSPPPPPPPSGGAEPQLVYRDGGVFLANEEGANTVQIRSDSWEPKLDAINERVLFIDAPSYAADSFVGMITYSIDIDGNINFEPEVPLISARPARSNTFSRGCFRLVTGWIEVQLLLSNTGNIQWSMGSSDGGRSRSRGVSECCTYGDLRKRRRWRP